jgi:hypothetical protein
MTPRRRHESAVAVLAVACLAMGACQLRRPDVAPTRMIEPLLVEPTRSDAQGATVTPVRLLATLSREHIGRRILRKQPGGELVEDSVWRWTSSPDRFLDMALRLALTASTEARLVDAGTARAVAVTLVEWHLDGDGRNRIVGAIAVEVTATDRHVGTTMIRAEEPVSLDLPGDLAAASGRLLQRLASDVVTRAARGQPDGPSPTTR